MVPVAFWDGLAGKVAEQFSVRVLTPALVFWAGGLGAWSWHQAHRRPGAGWSASLLQPASTFQRLPVVLQVAVLVAVLLVLSGSAAIAERLASPLLRLLEGYGWPLPLARPLRARIAGRRARRYRRWSELFARRDGDGLSDAEAAELDRLDEQLRRVPAALDLTMPTRLGNPLRVAETQARVKYGLGTPVWPLLWPLLDRDLREELTRARGALDAATRLWLWGALFALWAEWAWWALPVALLTCTASYYGGMLGAAQTYADLVEAAFALQRTRLYQSLRWPLPAGPEEEPEHGERLTTYVSRGIAPAGFAFDSPVDRDG